MAPDLALGVPLLFLLYAAPGLALAGAVFPEKLRRGAGWEAVVEVAVLAVVGSLAVTILLGAALAASPAGLGSTASDPSLWIADALVALAGAAVWVVRRGAPAAVAPEAPDPSWSALRSMERLAREERRLVRSLRSGSLAATDRRDLEGRLEAVRSERNRIARALEASHAT